MQQEYTGIEDRWTPTVEEFERITNNYDAKMEKDGMFDAYEGKLPESPDNEHYMKGYNSVKK